MPSIILSNVSKPKNLTGESTTTPLSFLEWSSRNIGISFSDAEAQYQTYLRDFNSTIQQKNDEAVGQLKKDYLNLISRLQVIFQNDEDFERYKNIDFSSEKDLMLAIPAYARKLKELALFYTKKRQELKNKKLEYNLVGSYDGLSKLLYSNLVSKFTKNQQTQFASENDYNAQSPEFSAICTDFSIEVEELYDTHDYSKDEENINPFACAFNDLCYSLFSTPLSAKADPIENLYRCEPDNDTVDSLLQQAYNKYLSTEICKISGGYYTEDLKSIEIPFSTGENFFYWFSGKTVFDIPEGIYKDININDMSWTGATGGTGMIDSDLILVNAGNDLTKGAWLQDTQYSTFTATMCATMTDGKIFKFPFPSFGTSAFGGEWSGPGFNDTIPLVKKFFPTEEDAQNTQNAINQIYWNSFSSISTVTPILLQDTSLGEGGYASNRYINADKVYITKDTESRTKYSGDIRVAWLYDFRQTQIPITLSSNQIYYPLQRFDNKNELTFSYNKGPAVALSSINVAEAFAGAVASESLETADFIVKQRTSCSDSLDEAAWLKGVPMRFYNQYTEGFCECGIDQQQYYSGWTILSGSSQPSLNFKCEPDNYVRFIWAGETTNINDVRGFTGFVHDDSCPYKRLNHSISLVDANSLNSSNKDLFEQWKKCSCKAIQHSPFGHNSAALDQFKIIPDFIIRDLSFPKPFSRKTWEGSDKKDFKNSKDSARFFPNLIEKDIGWGEGVWKSQTGSSFTLEKGKTYIYYRSANNSCDFESPYFLINDPYKNGTIKNDNCETISYIPQWYKAVKDESGNWVDAGVISDMILEFGDFLNYNHQPYAYTTYSRLLYSGNEVTTSDIVTVDSNDPLVSFKTLTDATSSVNFLIKIPIGTDNQFWAKANYGDDISNQKVSGSDLNELRIVFDYVQMTQPLPSDIELGHTDVLEYKFSNCNNECFVWSENLSFTVYNPIRQWNEIIFDNCIKSDILSYLTKEMTNCYLSGIGYPYSCGEPPKCTDCLHFCEPFKTGMTATNIKSDIVLNTELSGVPLFVNYYARSAFNERFVVQDLTNGEKSVFVPVDCIEEFIPRTPWRNLLNQAGSNFVIDENVNYLQTSNEINFYNPKRIGMSRYETFDSRSSLLSATSAYSIYRKDNYFDAPYEKSHKNSEYVTEFSLGKTQGNIELTKRQSFIPYTNTNEKSNRPYYGLYELPLKFTPWSETGQWDGGDIYKNFRNLYNINCSNNWYSNQLSLTGDVWNWETDIYGNHYFVTNDDALTYTETPSSYCKVFVKLQNNKVYTINDAMSSILASYNNIEPSLFDAFSAL